MATSSKSVSHSTSSSTEATSLLLGLLIFVQNCNHNGWCTSSFFDLQEGMIVVKFFFTIGTIVEVFADSALVANTDYRILSASIAADSFVYYDFPWNTFLRLFHLVELHVDVLFTEKLIKDKSGLLLEFLLHKSLQRFARNAIFFCSLVSVLTFLLFDWFRLLGLSLNLNFFNDVLNRLLYLLNNLRLWFNNSNCNGLGERLNFSSSLFSFLLLLFSLLLLLFSFLCSFFEGFLLFLHSSFCIP